MKLRNTFRSSVFYYILIVLASGILLGVSTSQKPEKSSDSRSPLLTDPVEVRQPGTKSKEHSLPLPTTLTLQKYEQKLYEFVLSRTYDTKLNWIVDKGVRDTGPWIKGKYYGTHPAVRIFYSPKFMYWLTGDSSYWPEGKVKKKKKWEFLHDGFKKAA